MKHLLLFLFVHFLTQTDCLEQRLIRAITMERVGDIRQLLAQDIDLSYHDDQGNTPLHHAAWQGKPLIIRLLLEHGACVHAVNDKQQTPLMIAVMGHKECAITLLLEHGASLHHQDCNGYSPLMLALFHRPHTSLRIMQLLLPYATPDDLLLTNNEGDTALLLAVYVKRYYVIEDLLKKISCYQEQERSAILNHLNHEHDSALTRACRLFENKIALLLIQAGADIEQENKFGNTPFIIAALSNNVVLIEKLLCCGVDINHQNEIGMSALMMATVRGYDKVVQRLLKQNANACLKNNEGKNAYELAITNRYKEIAQCILSYMA